MNYLLEVCLIALAVAATNISGSVAAQAAAAIPANSLAGTLKEGTNDLPGINFTIQEGDRRISRAIFFHPKKRANPNGWSQVAGESAVPLLVPYVGGATLSFAVRQRRYHECSELGAHAKSRMSLPGPTRLSSGI